MTDPMQWRSTEDQPDWRESGRMELRRGETVVRGWITLDESPCGDTPVIESFTAQDGSRLDFFRFDEWRMLPAVAVASREAADLLNALTTAPAGSRWLDGLILRVLFNSTVAKAPLYTTSVDAAATLTAGDPWTVIIIGVGRALGAVWKSEDTVVPDPADIGARAATPALALCAAALRHLQVISTKA